MTEIPRSAPRTRSQILGLVALAVTGVALFSVLVPLHAVFYGTPLPLAMLLGAGVCAAPWISLTRPRTAIVVFGVTAFVLPLVVSVPHDGAWPWPWSVPAMIAFVVFVLVITTLHGWRLGRWPWAVGNLGSLVAPLIITDAAPAATANLIVTASISTAVLLIGVLLAGRIRLNEQLTRERELTASEQSRRMLVEERTRIARELHDVLAHSMSVIQVQASTARYRLADLSDETVQEFDDIAASARASLGEMRRLLGVLRTEEQTPELAPQQGMADIPDLVDSVRRAGVQVGLSLAVMTTPPPAGVQIAVYRIVQEALSNAVRHAPGAALEVRVEARDGQVTIRVHNTASPEQAVDASSAGHGLRGIRERVALLGGTVTVGTDPAGGWTVAATLPTAGEESP
ncbi:sensor histidine kinase [Microbacterium binotii]|uniref:sensor histidine kinase n=1 Tax=Microbacterium binotii TaxID=462710 RepID=UPI001F3E327D|nr:sensor histidine kinase [Microbacterium binotii]UIN30575.1 sensor histidine kinase [Microbacterium binotii]